LTVLEAFDRGGLLLFRNPDGSMIGPAWLSESARDVTALGSNLVLGLFIVAVGGFLALDGKRRAALLLLVTFGGGLGLVGLAKSLTARARPDLVPQAAAVFTTSLPSSHATLSAALVLVCTAVASQGAAPAPRAAAISAAVVVVGLIGVSRIYLGLHWPSDVLAGWALGTAWGWACWTVIPR